MFTEIATNRTHSQGYRRRWFQSPTMDLYVWQNAAGKILGFQLAYDRLGTQRAITWIDGRGYLHSRIDDVPHGAVARTSFLKPEGEFDARRVHVEFVSQCGGLDSDIASLVTQRLHAYRESHPARGPNRWVLLALAATAGFVAGFTLSRARGRQPR